MAISAARALVCIGIGTLCTALIASAAAGQTTGSTPLVLVPQSTRGADLFRLYCATCHGIEGQGHAGAEDGAV
jgi:cytochrome c